LIDITSLLQADTDQTLRLRFAERDKVFTFDLGVDGVSVRGAVTPETSSPGFSAKGMAEGGFRHPR
jgi:hypothetical protein